ncbi:MAG: hypothetical protein K0R61_5080 [Microvirga sp.]|jgi:hypothetical protein|nr:hypothetical protein [Microvirga sp.]MDF2974630.1 hypothetical protein [Microvirga sp.]
MLFPEWFEAWLVIAQQCLAVLLVLCLLVYLWRRFADRRTHFRPGPE